MAKWGEINCPRCAELEEQIAAMEEGLTAVHMAGYMDGRKAAEAKLTKALRALERIELSTDTREQGAIAMATLTALKGQEARMSDALIDRKNVERLAQEFHDCDELPITLLSLYDRIKELEAKLAQQDDLVQAAVAAALRKAAKEASSGIHTHKIAQAILTLITPDAQAALDRVVAAERERGFWAGRSCGGSKAEIDAALNALCQGGE